MTQFTNPLNYIKIASPCSSDWDAMVGNNRQRYCGECKLNVYNLSGMTKYEAENLLMQSEGRVCVRYFRRADGTVLTKDCPVGWQAVRTKMSRFWTASVSLLITVFGGIGITSFLTQTVDSEVRANAQVIANQATTGTVSVVSPEMGGATPLMGDVAINRDEFMGKVSNFDHMKDQIIKKYSK
jgi:hypothetical protein